MHHLAKSLRLLALPLLFVGCLADSTDSTESDVTGDDPVACIEIAVQCPYGEAPADVDGDGCALECAPVVCPAIVVECPEGEVPMDIDGDGCALECGPVACPAIVVECPEGEVPMDLDGDGCPLECGVFCGNNP
jgi:hypothetical protein